MPNGGVPIHMVLHPSKGEGCVLYCHGGTLHIYDQPEWNARGARGTPQATLSEADCAALAWFLRYWLGDARLKPAYEMPGQVRAEFDF